MGKAAKMWLLVLLAVCGMAAAQEKEKPGKAAEPAVQPSFYRLDFVVKELEDGKILNTRNYSATTQADTLGPHPRESFIEVKAGSRVPINVGEKGTTYMDVGVMFNGRLRELEDGLMLGLNIELSSLALPEASVNAGPNPLVRQMRAVVSTPITLGKPILLASVDDPNSKHRFQVEVTATKLR